MVVIMKGAIVVEPSALTEADRQWIREQLALATQQAAPAAARTSPVKRVLFEQTFSGPNRHHAAAIKALTGAGFDAATAAPHHDGSGGDSWLTVTSTWDHDGLPDSGYQTDRMAAAGRVLEPYDYALRTHGVVGGWGQPA